jgi:hypothetical protein
LLLDAPQVILGLRRVVQQIRVLRIVTMATNG